MGMQLGDGTRAEDLWGRKMWQMCVAEVILTAVAKAGCLGRLATELGGLVWLCGGFLPLVTHDSDNKTKKTLSGSKSAHASKALSASTALRVPHETWHRKYERGRERGREGERERGREGERAEGLSDAERFGQHMEESASCPEYQ